MGKKLRTRKASPKDRRNKHRASYHQQTKSMAPYFTPILHFAALRYLEMCACSQSHDTRPLQTRELQIKNMLERLLCPVPKMCL